MFNKASIRLYTKQVTAIKHLFIATLVIGMVTSLVNTIQPLLQKSLFDNINSISAYQILVILAFLLLFTFLSALEGYLQNTIGNKIIANGRKQITRQIQYIDHESYDNCPKGELISRFTDDVIRISDAIKDGIVSPVSSIFTFCFAFIGMFLIDKVLLAFSLAFSLLGVVLSVISTKPIDKSSAKVQIANGQLTVTFESFLSSLPLLRAYNAIPVAANRTEAKITNHYNLMQKLTLQESIIRPLGGFIMYLALFGSVGVGAYRVSSGFTTLGSLVAFVMYLMMMVNPTSQILGGIAALQAGKASLLRVNELLNIKHDTSISSAIHVKTETVNRPAPGQHANLSAISFHNVSYRYECADNSFSLGTLTFDIARGTKTAIVGQSGSGKSTILSLIERFRVPASGAISLFGVPQLNYDIDQYRNHFAYIDQEAVALGGTLRENLLIANNSISKSMIKDSLAQVGLAYLCERLDVDLGDSGFKLSGGERQRISWARFLININRDVLLLDEPTSNVDSISNELLVNILSKASPSSTVLMVTHNISQIKNFGNVLVMDKGKLLGVGTHETLLEECEKYYYMALNQGVTN
ncbi:ABC transporter ATP-binding protein [Mobiluncus mulieris]|uniref:ABC transporter ATP-binding protein n=1 Tax=Mobiluncus mulieris TaxID=2052 RepID=UPI0021E2DC6E|nr:ABC transporter ATP-binding protein [Mobiluncus mulieris]MCV0003484.1 ABC transporter ATP-binding protein [Mobiluncus mulieris]